MVYIIPGVITYLYQVLNTQQQVSYKQMFNDTNIIGRKIQLSIYIVYILHDIDSTKYVFGVKMTIHELPRKELVLIYYIYYNDHIQTLTYLFSDYRNVEESVPRNETATFSSIMHRIITLRGLELTLSDT